MKILIKKRAAPLLAVVLLSSIIFSIILSCEEGENTSSGKHSYFKSSPYAPKSVEYAIDVSKGGEITMASGTVINIPANAFVDKAGNPVKGKVNIKYREFLDAASIIASGIPMTYDSGGVKHHFESAGMFEIRGYKQPAMHAQVLLEVLEDEAEEVFIATDQKISVDLASNVEGSRFNNYIYDEKSGNWAFIGKEMPRENPRKKAKLAKLEAEMPIPPKPEKPLEKKDTDRLFELSVNYKEFPELKTFQNILWQYEHSDEEIITQEWEDIALQPGTAGGYRVMLSAAGGGKTASIRVRPVFEGKSFAKAQEQFAKELAAYESIRGERLIEEARLEVDANFSRQVSVSKFGAHNIDVIYSDDQVLANVKATFKRKGTQEIIDNGRMYHVTGRNNTAIITYQLGSDGVANMRVGLTDVANKCVVILSENEIGYVDKEAIESELTDGNNTRTYELEVIKDISSINELIQVLNNKSA